MPQQMIRGLTLRHPWAFCVAYCGKDVENRTWHPSRQGGHVGMFIALHGGAMPPKTGEYWDEIADACSWIHRRGITDAWDAMHPLLKDGRGLCMTGIVAVARLAAVSQNDPSPWAAQDQYHWRMAELLVLPKPIPHRGAQGLWQIENAALVQLREAWMELRP